MNQPRTSFRMAVFFLAWSAVLADETVLSAAGRQNPFGSAGGTARAVAMGSAFVGVADDASALFWNPAGLSGLDASQISIHHTSWLSQTFQETMLWGMPAGDLGGLGLTANYVGYGSFEGRDASGFPTSDYGANQMGLGLGWGKKILGDFAVGASLQATQQNLAGSSYFLPSSNLGLLWKNREGWGGGLSVENLGPALSGNRLASSFLAGVSRQWKGSLSLLASLSGDVEPQGGNSLQAGLEAGYHSVLFLRAGYDLQLQNTGYGGIQGLTTGAGFRLDSFRLDYAFVPYGDLGATNLVSLGYSFGVVPTPVTAPAAKPLLPSTVPPANQAVTQATPIPGAAAPQTQRTITMEFDVPGDPEITQAQALAKAGQWNEAVAAFELIIKKNPTDATAWRELGNVYYQMNLKDYAITCFQQTLKLNPDNKALSDWLEHYQGK